MGTPGSRSRTRSQTDCPAMPPPMTRIPLMARQVGRAVARRVPPRVESGRGGGLPMSQSKPRGSISGPMPRPRKQLDFRAAAEALTAPGAEVATMAVIARRLDVAKPTLYRMAGSREELVQICIDAEAERLLEQLHRAHGLRGLVRVAEVSPA